MSSYIKDLCKGKSDAWIEGFAQGVRAFAWWKDGSQYVGTTGTKLKDVIADIQLEIGVNQHEAKLRAKPETEKCPDCEGTGMAGQCFRCGGTGLAKPDIEQENEVLREQNLG